MAAKKTLTPWHRAKPAPIVLISGPEAVLARKAQDTVLAKAKKTHGDDITHLDANSYQPGELAQAAAPSLFTTRGIVVVDNCATMNDAFLDDALAYAAEPSEDMVVILKHSGGNRGARLIKALEKAEFPRIDASALKSEADKNAFAEGEFKRAGRSIRPDALAALMDALGSDVSELDQGIRQLLADTEGEITHQIVDRYYGGRVEATGFKVADAACSGNTGQALALTRHALSTGTDPVPIVAAIALKLRQLAKVQGLSGSSGQLAAELKMAPWQVDRARRQVRQWNEAELGRALLSVAAADAAVKGGGRDPEFAVETLVREVAQAARRR